MISKSGDVDLRYSRRRCHGVGAFPDKARGITRPLKDKIRSQSHSRMSSPSTVPRLHRRSPRTQPLPISRTRKNDVDILLSLAPPHAPINPRFPTAPGPSISISTAVPLRQPIPSLSRTSCLPRRILQVPYHQRVRHPSPSTSRPLPPRHPLHHLPEPHLESPHPINSLQPPNRPPRLHLCMRHKLLRV